MLKFYKTEANSIVELQDIESGCWISAEAPTEAEISRLENELSIDRDFIRSALDEEERSRIETEENQTLIIFDYPIAQKSDDKEETITYSTMPMGIILTDTNVVTVSLKHNSIIEDFANGVVKGVKTQFKTQFIFNILLKTAGKYLLYLKQIEKISTLVENKLNQSMKNKELIQLLGLEKSLVYFSTSLKSTESVLEKILRGRVIKLYDDDQDLLEDVLTEVKQAIETCTIYSNIFPVTMDAYASVISNNLNMIMRVLTIITIIMEIPNIVFSFYGMNVEGLPFIGSPIFSISLAIVLAVLVGITLSLKKFNK